MITAPAPTNLGTTATPAVLIGVKPFPIQPGEWWDDRPRGAVEWQVESPRCLFWRGALALGLRYKFVGKTLSVKTSQEEIARLLIWSWEQK